MLFEYTGTGFFLSSTPMLWLPLVSGEAVSKVDNDDCLLNGSFFCEEAWDLFNFLIVELIVFFFFSDN